MASATALLFTEGQQADLYSRGRREVQAVTTAWDALHVRALPYFAATWTCVHGSKIQRTVLSSHVHIRC